MSPIELATLISLWLMASGSTVFVVTYHALARWWESAVGINIMVLMASLAALTDLLLVNVSIGRPEWMRWVFAALCGVIGCVIWWRVVLLVRAQRPRWPRS
jgi:hypothetical protein